MSLFLIGSLSSLTRVEFHWLRSKPSPPGLSKVDHLEGSSVFRLVIQLPATVSTGLDVNDFLLNVFQSGTDDSRMFSSSCISESDRQGSFARVFVRLEAGGFFRHWNFESQWERLKNKLLTNSWQIYVWSDLTESPPTCTADL
jgi:hypothetical protein